MSQIQPYESIPIIEAPEDYRFRTAEFLAEMYAQHGPVFRQATPLGRDIVYLIGPEANRYVMVNGRQKFSHQIGWGEMFGIDQLLGRGLLTMDGSAHDQHRKLMNPAFTLSYMERYLPLMHGVIRRRVAQWAESGEVNIYEEMRKITFDIAAEALTGLVAGEEVDTFRKIFVGLLNGPEDMSPETTEEEYMAAIVPLQLQLYSLLIPKIEERRLNPTDDVFGLLVQARNADGEALSNEQIISHVNILLVAGHETSTSLSTWLLYLLNQHPDYTRRILDEQAEVLTPGAEPTLEEIKRMKVLDNALSEAERLYPPVTNGPRGVLEDFDFHGYHVPAGSLLLYSIAGSHVLPHIFANPTQFDPDRFAPPREEQKKNPYALVGFGGGPRICIGINFAQVEIKALTTYILRNYNLELVPDQQITLVYDVTSWPLNGIKMKVTAK